MTTIPAPEKPSARTPIRPAARPRRRLHWLRWLVLTVVILLLMRWIARVLALTLVLVGMALPASAEQGEPPLKGTVTGVANFLSNEDCVPVGLRTESDATGIVSHLGRVVMSSAHCTPPGIHISGRMTLNAANGDQLYLDYWGTCVPDTPELVDGETYFVCDNPSEIAGGSGRFDDATGSGTIDARVLFAGFGEPDWPGT